MSEKAAPLPSLDEILKAAPQAMDHFTKAIKEVREAVDDLSMAAGKERDKRLSVTRRLKEAGALLKALGYTTDGGYSMWSHVSLHKCPGCGGIPLVQEYRFGGGWVIICQSCSHRTDSYDDPESAIWAWNNNRYTALSEMTMYRLDGSKRGEHHEQK